MRNAALTIVPPRGRERERRTERGARACRQPDVRSLKNERSTQEATRVPHYLHVRVPLPFMKTEKPNKTMHNDDQP